MTCLLQNEADKHSATRRKQAIKLQELGHMVASDGCLYEHVAKPTFSSKKKNLKSDNFLHRIRKQLHNVFFFPSKTPSQFIDVNSCKRHK